MQIFEPEVLRLRCSRGHRWSALAILQPDEEELGLSFEVQAGDRSITLNNVCAECLIELLQQHEIGVVSYDRDA